MLLIFLLNILLGQASGYGKYPMCKSAIVKNFYPFSFPLDTCIDKWTPMGWVSQKLTCASTVLSMGVYANPMCQGNSTKDLVSAALLESMCNETIACKVAEVEIYESARGGCNVTDAKFAPNYVHVPLETCVMIHPSLRPGVPFVYGKFTCNKTQLFVHFYPAMGCPGYPLLNATSIVSTMCNSVNGSTALNCNGMGWMNRVALPAKPTKSPTKMPSKSPTKTPTKSPTTTAAPPGTTASSNRIKIISSLFLVLVMLLN